MASIFQINTVNGERSFECSSSESILQAGLRSGLSLRYKCVNGTCGECRTQLISGDIQPLYPHDSILTKQDRADGWFPSCAYAPRSDLEISPPMFGQSTDIPFQLIHCKVKRIQQILPDLTRLTIRTPRSNTFQFLAGQDVILSHLHAQHRYPIASCPCSGGELEFHIRRSEQDPFSKLLFSSLKRGDSVTIEGPRGQFCLNETSNRAFVFVAWENGFAPIQSLIQHFISLEMDNPVLFFWLSEEPPYMENQVRAWSEILDPFHYQWIDMKDTSDQDRAAKLVALIAQHTSVTSPEFYISAPPSLLIALSEALLLAGLDEAQLHGSPL